MVNHYCGSGSCCEKARVRRGGWRSESEQQSVVGWRVDWTIEKGLMMARRQTVDSTRQNF